METVIVHQWDIEQAPDGVRVWEGRIEVPEWRGLAQRRVVIKDALPSEVLLIVSDGKQFFSKIMTSGNVVRHDVWENKQKVAWEYANRLVQKC